MAKVLPTSKQSVDLASSGQKISRIRRDPPPPVKPIEAIDIEERESWTIAIGVMSFALALFVIVLGLSAAAGWSPSQYSLNLKEPPRVAVKDR